MDTLLELAEPWLYILVFVLAAAEGAALVGLVLPGESSMLVAGVVVYQGNAEGLLVYASGIAGAVIGDSVGYWVGRKFGPRLRASWLGRRVGEERWDKAFSYLRERGGRAVFFGRFAGFLRTLVPPAAGQAEMPFRRFVAFNAPAATLWAALFISLGVVAGSSWHTVEVWAGRASAFVAILVVTVIGLVVTARWAQGHKETVLEAWRRLLEQDRVRSFRRRFSKQITFVRRRFDPREEFGLLLSVGVGMVLAAGIAFGAMIDAAREGDDLGRIDEAVQSFVSDHHSSTLDDVVGVMTTAFSAPVLCAVTALLGAAIWFVRRRAVWAVFGVLASIGGLWLDDLVAGALELLHLPAPPQFPSGELLAMTLLAGSIVFLAGSLWGWKAAIWGTTAALGLLLACALTFTYDGTLVSAQLGGISLGLVWIAACGTGAFQFERPLDQ